MEVPMTKTFFLAAAAALMMASTAAHAGSGTSFEIDGQKFHIEMPSNCSSLSCLSVSKNGSAVNLKDINLKGKKSDGDDDVATTTAPPPPVQQQLTAPAVQPPAPAPLPPIANTAQPAQPAQVADTAAPSSHERLSGLPAQTNNAPARTEAPAQTNQVPVANSAPVVQQDAAASVTPLGLWQTEDNKGNVRIEQCGANLCGYGEKNGEKNNDLVLINMKPSSDNSKWTGRIHNPESDSNYDSTIAMKGPNLLKVQGCALGGVFCGGTTWKRIS
jgi:uncharacterized protein (DUF2147 family)